jgi:acyl carrier protein
MPDQNQIQQGVFNAIDRLNQVLPDGQALPKEADVILFGSGAQLDSMGFINFAVALEDELAESAGLRINLAEELNAPANSTAKPATVGELIAFLCALAKTKSGAGEDS